MSVAMQIETFECAEVASEPIEASEEALRIIQEMELEGQKEFLAQHEGTDKQVRCPYRLITQEEFFVYKVFCPISFNLEKYNHAPIPLRVLQIAEHAKKVIPNCRLKVWDKSKHEVKDPVLLAEVGQYDWSPDKVYILARWGEVLETFTVLRKNAMAQYRDKCLQLAAAILSKVKICPEETLMKKGATTFPVWQ